MAFFIAQKKSSPRGAFVFLPMTGLRVSRRFAENSSLLVRMKAKTLAFFIAQKKAPRGELLFFCR